MQGGFIWDFVDQGLTLPPPPSSSTTSTPTTSSLKRYGYGGDFGDIPNTQQFCINGLLGPDRVPHPIALEAKFLQSPVMLRIMPYEDENGKSDENDVCIVILNLHTQRSLDYVHVTVALGCDVASPCDESKRQPVPTSNVPAGKAKSFRLSQIIPALTKSATAADVATLLNISTPRLAMSQEIWVDVKVEVKQGFGTEWVPAGHVILQTSLTHPLLNKNLRDKVDIDAASVAAAAANAAKKTSSRKALRGTELVSIPPILRRMRSHSHTMKGIKQVRR